MSVGVAEVKELVKGGTTVMGGLHAFKQEVSVLVLQLYSPIITFTIQRQLGAHAQEVSGDHVTAAVCVCVCALHNPNRDPSTHLCQSSPLPLPPAPMVVDVTVHLRNAHTHFSPRHTHI